MGNCCSLIKKQYCSCTKRPRRKVVLLMIGLDNAGKTSTLKTLTGEGGVEVVPTVGFASATLSHRRVSVTLLDLGGGTSIRGIWPRYFGRAHGILFVVDASDEMRLREAAMELDTALKHPQLAGKPLLLLATKQDRAGALDELDVVAALELEALVNKQRCPTLVETCSTGQRRPDAALVNGYKWLVGTVQADWDSLNARVESDCADQAAQDEQDRLERASRVEKLRAERGVNGADQDEDAEAGDDPFKPVHDLVGNKSAGSARLILVQESPSRTQTIDTEPLVTDTGKAKKNGNNGAARAHMSSLVSDSEDERDYVVQDSISLSPEISWFGKSYSKMAAKIKVVSIVLRTSKMFQVKKPIHSRTQSQANVIPSGEERRSRPSSATGSATATGPDDRPMSAGPADAWSEGAAQPQASKVAMKEYVKDQLGLAGKPRNRLPLRRNNKTAPAPPDKPAPPEKPGRSPRPARRADGPAILSVVQTPNALDSPSAQRLPPLRNARPPRPDSAGSPTNWELERPLDTIIMSYPVNPPQDDSDDVVVTRRQ